MAGQSLHEVKVGSFVILHACQFDEFGDKDHGIDKLDELALLQNLLLGGGAKQRLLEVLDFNSVVLSVVLDVRDLLSLATELGGRRLVGDDAFDLVDAVVSVVGDY